MDSQIQFLRSLLRTSRFAHFELAFSVFELHLEEESLAEIERFVFDEYHWFV